MISKFTTPTNIDLSSNSRTFGSEPKNWGANPCRSANERHDMSEWIIYKTTNKFNGKVYIGQKFGYARPGYLGSGKLLKIAIKEHGKGGFTRETLATAQNQEDADRLERKYIAEFNSTDRATGYNITVGGNGAWGPDSEETKLRKSGPKPWVSEARVGKTLSALGHNEDTCICCFCMYKRGEYKGKTYSEKYGVDRAVEIRNKNSKVQRGRTKPQDQTEKNRLAHIGRKHIHNLKTKESRLVRKEQVLHYLSTGWTLGRSPEVNQVLQKAAVKRCLKLSLIG